jgi:GNAT superfamily N-acetyltransferase
MSGKLPNFLPGRLTLSRGERSDYIELEAFHYIPKRPATWADVWTIYYHPDRANDSRLIAVGVLSYPAPFCKTRNHFFHREKFSLKENLMFINRNLRTISRVIVHPQFRSLGLSTILVRCLCDNCPTRYVEALAQMGRAHPFFERAGMTRIEPDNPDGPIYFIHDRNSQFHNQ